MRKAANGFTLFEVLVSMFITGVALLGLALMEVHILKSSQSSFNYTVATIRANSFVDAVWADLCNAQQSADTYADIRTGWRDEIFAAAGMQADDNSPPGRYDQENDTSVIIILNDPRFSDSPSNSELTLKARFPDSGCG